MEDAYIMAQVVQDIAKHDTVKERPERECIDAAFTGYETVRRARFERVLDTSYDAMSFWSDFWRPDLTEVDLEQFRKDADDRMRWIWDARLEEQGQRARTTAQEALVRRVHGSQTKQAM